MKGYISIREMSYKWGVNQYCTQGRIPGAERFGRSWAIPSNAKKPEDPRKDRKNSIQRNLNSTSKEAKFNVQSTT